MAKSFSKHDKSSMPKKHNRPNKTKTCKHKSRKPLIFKMGGLLCPNCRTILHEAYSPKWLKRIKNNKLKKEFEIEE